MYSMDGLVGVLHMLVFPVCRYDDMMESFFFLLTLQPTVGLHFAAL